MDDDTLLSHGFDAGNYANAYTSEDLDEAWEIEEDGRPGNAESEHFRAAFVIGFFSSYEEHEIPEDHQDEHAAAMAERGPRLRAIGVAVD